MQGPTYTDWPELGMELKVSRKSIAVEHALINPFMPTVAFNICCPRDCVSRHNGGETQMLNWQL